MVAKIPFVNCPAIRISVDRLTKNLSCLQGWSCRKSNSYRIKVFDDIAVLALIIKLVPEEQFFVRHFFIKNITPVGFVNND